MATDPKLSANPGKNPWAWHPNLPITTSPVLTWPPKPVNALRFLLGRGFVYSINGIFVVLALLTWFYWLPPMAQWASFSLGWIAHVLAINLALIVIVAGGLHLYFHTFRLQGSAHKFEEKELDRDNPKFLFNNQVWDNIFWSCVSGIPQVTVWQVVAMWAFANGYTPWLDWEQHPVLFVLMFPLITLWSSLHFYWIHRFIHWPPLFKIAHALHHRNINVGPWSGISMHPIEHILYFSSLIIHFVVFSHPVHLFYHVYHEALGPPASHSGFADIQIKGKPVFGLGDFFHQLHHKYFDCNYGTSFMQWDKWFGSFHDGTPEATTALRQHQLQRRGVRGKE